MKKTVLFVIVLLYQWCVSYSNDIFSGKSGIYMVRMPAGSFLLGSESEENEQPVHEVSINGFLMSATEITQFQYKQVTGTNPSYFSGDTLPVDQVTWFDAVLFCNRLSEKTQLEKCYDEDTWECDFSKNGFRLPTEAEWEYACRAGTTTNYYSGERVLTRAGWYRNNSSASPHPVGEKKPNAFGLYDMHGNVWEWCNDRYEKDYYAKSPPNNPTGPAESQHRIKRGGSWNAYIHFCRSAERDICLPNLKSFNLGFRIAQSEIR